jgi:peptidoglycan/xylan/chitin deacetylase (PgdA/CDA1 family)
MSRFLVTTILAVAAAAAGVILLHGMARFWFSIAVVAIYLASFAAGMTCIGLQFFCNAICHGDPAEKTVALTFDDGPDPNVTPALLDWLKTERISATFFCIGKHAEAHPELVKRIAAEGHLIGNHFFTHGWWTPLLLSRGLANEMQRTQRAIENATGCRPIFARPPAGLTNPHFTSALRAVGLTLVGWNLRTFDTARSAQWVIRRIRKRVAGGSIIVLHDRNADSAKLSAILSDIVPFLRASGIAFARVDHLRKTGFQPVLEP